MLHLTLQELLVQRWRTGLTVTAFGAVVSLLLLFEGFRVGVLRDLEQFPASLPADLVVVQAGVENFAVARSSLRQLTRREVEAIDGVVAADALLLLPIVLEHGEHRTPVQILVYNERARAPSLASGRHAEGLHEIVMDARLARHHELELGDTIEVFAYRFEIVGLSSGTGSPFAPYLFVTYDDLIEMYLEADLPLSADSVSILGALVVELEPGADVHAVRREIEATISDVDVYSPAELGVLDANLGRRLLGPALNLLISVAWIIAWLTFSLGMHSVVRSRLREYAVVSAIGATPGAIMGAMLMTAAVLTVAALPVGLLIAQGIAVAIEHATPLYSAVPGDPAVVARATAATLGACAFGVIPAARRITRVDPDEAFRGASI